MPAYSDYSCFIDSAGLHVSGSGKIVSLLASHGDASAQTITIYDGLDTSYPILLQVIIPAGGAPVSIEFKPWALSFTNGLYIDPGLCKMFIEKVVV